jgi:PAS domain S-box-containing protein
VKKRKRAKRGLEKILTGAGDGVFAVGPNGHIVLWNHAARRILGWSDREAIGRTCREVLGRAIEDGKDRVHHVEMRARTKSGRTVWLDITVIKAQPAGPKGATLLHLIRDITATRELLRLVEARQRASAAPSTQTTTLTRRELEILRLMAGGANTRRLAERLHVSPSTIRNHAQNIFTKLGVHSRLEAVAHATRHRLLAGS